MTTQELIAAGWTEHPDRTGNRSKRALYQKSVRDEFGIRYWLNVQHYVWPNGDDSFECQLCFINGITGWETPLSLWAAVHDKTPAEVLTLADSLWTALRPKHYERGE